MTRHPRPTMHGRDHAPDGPDPIPGLVLDGGDTPFTVTYAAGTKYGFNVTTGFSAYMTFNNVHSSGVTISTGGVVTIEESGVYEVLAAGVASIDGPATAVSPPSLQLEMHLIVNGTNDDGLGGNYGYCLAISPVDVDSGRKWHAPMTVLEQHTFAAADELKFHAVNATPVTATFYNWRVVVTKLGS